MATTIPPDFERVCDQEFELDVDDAYEGLDREIADIREQMNSMGCYWSTAMGQSVMDAMLNRFDKVIDAFEQVYIGKWRSNPSLTFTSGDYTWLLRKIETTLAGKAWDVEYRCNNFLWEQSQLLKPYWESTGVEAMRRVAKMRKRLEVLKMQSDHRRPSQEMSEDQTQIRPGQTIINLFNSRIEQVIQNSGNQVTIGQNKRGRELDHVFDAIDKMVEIVRQDADIAAEQKEDYEIEASQLKDELSKSKANLHQLRGYVSFLADADGVLGIAERVVRYLPVITEFIGRIAP